jgi:beta-alanine--pyruvate transaminase
VRDIRNLGLVAGIELEPRPSHPGGRGYEVFLRCLERGVLVRYTGDTLALSPPLIIEPRQIEQLFGTIAETLRSVS